MWVWNFRQSMLPSPWNWHNRRKKLRDGIEKPYSSEPLDTATPSAWSFSGCLFCEPINSLVLSRLNEFFPTGKRDIIYLSHMVRTDYCSSCVCVHVCAQLCPTLCDLMDFSPLGSYVHGILQARILEWVAIPYSRGSSWPRDRICTSCTGR